MPAGNKHACSFVLIISDEDKKFQKFDTCGPISVSSVMADWPNTLSP